MFSSKKNLTHVLSVLVYCSHDHSFLFLFDEERGDYWIPSTAITDKNSWKDNLRSFKKKLFDCEVISEKLMKIIKVWTLEKEFFHLIFQLTIPKEIKTNCKSQTQLGKVEWYTCAQLTELKPLLRSLEILEIVSNHQKKVSKQLKNQSGEIASMGPLIEIRETDVILSEKNFSDEIYLDLLDSAKILTEGQYDFYEEFLIHTYPCIYMNISAFKRAISKFNYGGDNVDLFRAADVWKRDFLTFQDYLFLIAVMLPHTAHYGHLAEIRCQYIFRFYDKNKDGKIDYYDLQNLIMDIQAAKSKDGDNYESNAEVTTVLKSLGFNSNSVLSFDQFYNYVLQSKILDTTLLLRFSQEYYALTLQEMKANAYQKSMMPSSIILPSVPLTDEENTGDYELILETVVLKPGNLSNTAKDNQLFDGSVTTSMSEEAPALPKSNISRNYEIDKKINEILLALNYFRTQIDQNSYEKYDLEEKEAYCWGSAYLENLGITLIMICDELKTVLSEEPRLLEINSPVYVLGDIHGNFRDLICFEKTLWTNGIHLTPQKLLFLGDYVDRGSHSLEVVMYLFANKLKNVDKLYLIRGNHEIRDIQKCFTFQRECIFKLGSSLGTAVWKAVNDVFDVMPIAAVIDQKIFCCHGGIPPPWLCPLVSVINSIPSPLVNCERQSPLAWTLMWNDPLKNLQQGPLQDIELFANEGFIPNVHRGTGYTFSCDALEKFLKTNKLSYVIRAHELVKTGFQVHHKGRLLTVFSSSGYCGGKNQAASILVADKVLKIFMIDTGIGIS